MYRLYMYISTDSKGGRSLDTGASVATIDVTIDNRQCIWLNWGWSFHMIFSAMSPFLKISWNYGPSIDLHSYISLCIGWGGAHGMCGYSDIVLDLSCRKPHYSPVGLSWYLHLGLGLASIRSWYHTRHIHIGKYTKFTYFGVLYSNTIPHSKIKYLRVLTINHTTQRHNKSPFLASLVPISVCLTIANKINIVFKLIGFTYGRTSRKGSCEG